MFYLLNLTTITLNLALVEIVFNFFLIEKDKEKYYIDNWSTLPLVVVSKTKLEKFDVSLGGGSYSLPPNQDYTKWGLVLTSSDILNLTIIMAPDSTIYRVATSTPTARNTQIEIIKGQQTILTFTDSQYSDDIFERKFDKFTYYIKNGKIILKVKELKTEFLQTKKPTNILPIDPRIITFDLETITSASDGLMTFYLYSMFDGKDKFHRFTNSPEDLFKELLRSKYFGYSA